MLRAVVIFEDNNDHPLSFLLRRGFRHAWCAVIDETERYWIGHNLLGSGYISTVQADASLDLAAHYRDQGLEVIEVELPYRRAIGPTMAASCVGIIKQALGLRSFAFTPWQLHRHLTRLEQPMRLRDLLTLPGFATSTPTPPPPPAAAQPTPTARDVQSSRAMTESRTRARRVQGTQGTLRTSGGGMGQAVQQYQLASKQLTGQ